MKKLILIAILWLIASGAYAQLPLLTSSDLSYQGSFRLPAGQYGGSTFSYGGTALAYNPTHNSLFIVGHDWDQQVAEISIPVLKTGALSGLNTAKVLQNFYDITEGQMKYIRVGGAYYEDNVKVGGLHVSGSTIVGSVYAYYDGPSLQYLSHFTSGTTLSTLGDFSGMYRIAEGSLYEGWVSAYMTPVPSEHRAALGGDLLVGDCCKAIDGSQSHGPSVASINASDITTGTSDHLLGYPYPTHTTLGRYSDYGVVRPVLNLMTTVNGVVIPNGSRTLFFFGQTGLGVTCYG